METPDDKFGPAPSRFDQQGPYQAGYRDGYSAAMAFFLKSVAKRPPVNSTKEGD